MTRKCSKGTVGSPKEDLYMVVNMFIDMFVDMFVDQQQPPHSFSDLRKSITLFTKGSLILLFFFFFVAISPSR